MNHESNTNSEPIAVVGMSCLFPGADDLRSYWANIKNGVDAITDVPTDTHWDPSEYFDKDPAAPDMTYAAKGGFLSPVDFDPLEFGISPKDIEAIDTTQLLGLLAAKQALRDAGLDNGKLNRDRTSVILGVTGTLELVIPLGARLGHPLWRRALREAGVEDELADDIVRRISEKYVPWQENSFPGLLGNVAAGRIANRLDLGGTNCVVDAACASSLSAIHLACLELASGKSDTVLTGGLDTFNDIFMYMCFSKTPALSPTGSAKPFSKAGDGTILGEGIGMMVLKRLGDAKRDNDRIYAVIKGLGSSSDGAGNAVYAPMPKGQTKALRRACEQAGVTPDTIELVEAHGTGTIVGDATEVRALTEVYTESGREGSWCALGSVKSQIGHTKAAAGAAGMIKAILALHHRVLPPTIRVETPIEEAAPGKSPFYVNTTKRPWIGETSHPRRAGVSAFGFGGSNFHCLLEEYEAEKAEPDWDGDIQIVAFSGESEGELLEQLTEFPSSQRWTDFCYQSSRSRQSFDPAKSRRLLLVVRSDPGHFEALRDSCRGKFELHRDSPGPALPDGVFYGVGELTGKLGVLFPGQGSQYVGMLRDLACQFPEMQSVLARANEIFESENGSQPARRLSDCVYPHPAFDEETRASQEAELRATQVAQPAIGAVSFGALKVLERFGVSPDAAAGHSYGELTALCAAGCFQSDILHRLSNFRGRLMAKSGGGAKGDAGAMVAAGASSKQIEDLVSEAGLELVVANRNAPDQSVLAGATDEIERAIDILQERSIWNQKLPVAAAFHSPLVADARGPFEENLREVRFETARVPVFSNTTAKPYPHSTAGARSLLAGQLAKPVDFVGEIRAMHEAGVTTFLETGPGCTLSGLVNRILDHDDVCALSLDASRGKNSGVRDLALVLAQLAALGHPVDLSRWDPRVDEFRPREKEPKLTVSLCGANQRHEKPVTRPPIRIKSDPMSPSPKSRAPEPTPPSGNLHQALAVTREGMQALQRLQEETARLHSQFLEGQAQAQQTVQQLIEQQNQMLSGGSTRRDLVMTPLETAPLPPVEPPVFETPRSVPAPVEATPVPEPRDGDQVSNLLIEVVADKTGYPAEMLELSMELDTDLGIDSIKRVEILAALEEKLPNETKTEPSQLGEFRTLQDIVHFLGEGGSAPVSAPEPGGVLSRESVGPVLLQVVSETTGYPSEMLELGMSMDADLGIDSIKRVEIMAALQQKLPEAPELKAAEFGSLETLRDVVDELCKSCGGSEAENPSHRERDIPSHEPKPTSASQELSRQILEPFGLAPDSGSPAVRLDPDSRIWITADGSRLGGALEKQLKDRGFRVDRASIGKLMEKEPPANLAGLFLLAPAKSIDDDFPEKAFGLLQHAGPPLRKRGENGGALLATVSRLDGAFGLSHLNGSANPVSGGLAGLAKTARLEWPGVHCRALDLDAKFTEPDDAAAAILEEAFRGGPVEVGLSADARISIRLKTEPLPEPGDQAPLNRGDVVLVSGGGRGVTAFAAIAIAREFQPRLVLLGRSEAPQEEPEWLEEFRDGSEIRRAIYSRLQDGSPAGIEKEYRLRMANREMLSNLAAMKEAGAEVSYESVDVRDREAVAGLAEKIRTKHGPICGLVHGAGVLADKRIEDKTAEQFDLVYSTKVEGLRALLDATREDDLKVIALFSSFTGRHGRIGQIDYAAANEVINKLAQIEARRREACRVVSINWGPWNGGMVDSSLKNVFEDEGVGLIEPRAGADYLVNELRAPRTEDSPVEIVVIAPGPDGTLVAREPEKTVHSVIERVVSIQEMPILSSHVINARAVLPAAIMTEWLAHGALHDQPGMHFVGYDDFRVFKGVILDPDSSQSVKTEVSEPQQINGQLVVPVRLVSDVGGKRVHHAAASILLSARPPREEKSKVDLALSSGARTGDEIYSSRQLFHGPLLHGIRELEGCGAQGIAGTVISAPPPGEWIRNPQRGRWITDPLIIDCAWQLMILWTRDQLGNASLPAAVGSYRQFRRSFSPDGTRILIRVTESKPSSARADIEFLDKNGTLVARMSGYECVVDTSLKGAFELNMVG